MITLEDSLRMFYEVPKNFTKVYLGALPRYALKMLYEAPARCFPEKLLLAGTSES